MKVGKNFKSHRSLVGVAAFAAEKFFDDGQPLVLEIGQDGHEDHAANEHGQDVLASNVHVPLAKAVIAR